MSRFPASIPLVAALALVFPACERPPDEATPDVPRLPFDGSVLGPDSFRMVNGIGDTLRFAVTPTGAGTRIARYRRVDPGVDSLVAIVDPTTLVPVSSLQHRHLTGGAVTAEVRYGEGFDGQARLRLSAARGERDDNIRTPPPVLDAAQIPVSFGALDLGALDSLSFNYVAPFEGRALAARLVATSDTLTIGGTQHAALRLRLLVSGLEERYWFEAEPPHRLLRIQEVTRNMTWDRG
ncbi:MAG TPA: hypothetical protein VJP59_00340 [Gemmatimonadota bacterium]|nr:hypothetical protein [Gemmatimonadota bacterium]